MHAAPACASGEAQMLFGMLGRAPTSVASVFVLTAVLAGQSGSSTIAGHGRRASFSPARG
ncbi:MAG: hypothetical protein DMF94_13435 [Acidobacteria bacterium]|nr:MAG: hypothetical protein DMF96_14935 [Acidobacteriota bacterium]PYR20079.1 MAG: hypothetical protein DMF94_13435 [Acidobacteriota bacterium]